MPVRHPNPKRVVLLLAAVVFAALPLVPAQKKSVRAEEPSLTSLKSVGSEKAPVKLEEFSDFQCPACRQLYLQTLRRVTADYVVTGKVYLVHHDFPLPIHKYARQAARYANAAAKLRKFSEVEEALFTRQDLWSRDGDVESAVASVLTPAEMEKVKKLAGEPEIDAAIERDIFLGTTAGVRQTPTMILTHSGKPYPMTGIVSYPILRRFLDDLLSK